MTDTSALLQAADEQDPEFGALLRVLAATGARRGEVCGLRFPTSTPPAAPSLHPSFRGVGAGRDDRAGHQDARRTAHRARPRHAGRARPPPQGDGEACEGLPRVVRGRRVRVHVDGDGSEPLHPDSVTGGFCCLSDRVGITGVRLHDLRHLHASSLHRHREARRLRRARRDPRSRLRLCRLVVLSTCVRDHQLRTQCA